MPNVLSQLELKESLRAELNRHLTLSHPIFNRLLAPGSDDRELLRRVTLQGYQLTKHFLTYIENLFVRCPLPQFKRALLVNAYEEETGRISKTDNHVTLMENFIRALDIPDDERDAAKPLPATQALIDYRMAAVLDPTRYHVGAAAVLIASEGQNLETTADSARHELLGKRYNLSERDLWFFSVHQKEDVGHVEQGLNLVSTLCTTKRMQEEALFAVGYTCQLFYAMYENMYQVFCRQAEAAT